jgi:hypothetical protein
MNAALVKIVSLALLVSGLPIGSCSPPAASAQITGTYTKANRPAVKKIDLSADRIQNSAFKSDPKTDCYVLQPDFCVAIAIDMAQNDHRDRNPEKFGRRMFLVETANGTLKVRDRSTGSGGSYILSPTFYQNSVDGSWLILAETGFEYSSGIRVFIVKDKVMADVGQLDVAFMKKFNEQQKFDQHKTNGATHAITNEVSIVPYTVIDTVNNSLVFSFTQDVEHRPGGRDQKTIAKTRIRYVYSPGQNQGKLQEVIDPEPAAAFPDDLRSVVDHRPLSAKTLQGQFKNLEQGDYLYAIVTTPAKEVTFLIEGHESCFLQQTKGQPLTVQYDQLERYTPEMGGYRSVNIIRDIRSPQTDLRTWQSKVTPAELARCEGLGK